MTPQYPGAYDVTAVGERFVVAVNNPDAAAKGIHITLNFFDDLRAKVGNE